MKKFIWIALILYACVRMAAFVTFIDFNDEADKIIGAHLISNGGTLYKDVFSQHGVLPYLGALPLGGVFGFDNVLVFRWANILLLLLCWSLVPMMDRRFRSMNFLGLSFSLIAAFLPLWWGHMWLYQNLAGALAIPLLFFGLMPALSMDTHTKGRGIPEVTGLLILFSAFTYAGAVFLAWFGWILRSKKKGVFTLLLAVLAFGLLLKFSGVVDLKGYYLFHVLFNQQFYLKYALFEQPLVFSPLWKFFQDPSFILKPGESWFFWALLTVPLWELSSPQLKRIALWKRGIRIVLLGLFLLLLNPRGARGFHAAAFYMAALFLLSQSLFFLLQKFKNKSTAATIFVSLFFLIVIPYVQVHPQNGKRSRWQDLRDSSSKNLDRYSGAIDLIRQETAASDRIAAFPYEPLFYVSVGRMPVSGLYFVFPWVTDYLREPYPGYEFAFCQDFEKNQAKFILMNPNPIWNKYSPETFIPQCVLESLKAKYEKIPFPRGESPFLLYRRRL